MQNASRPLERLAHGVRRASPTRIACACAIAFAAAPAASAMAAPNGMHYEMVSPADAKGTVAAPGIQSSDGGRIELRVGSGQGFGGTPSMFEVNNLFASSRTPSGWVTTPLNPPASPDRKVSYGLDYTPDVLTALAKTSTLEQHHQGQAQLVVTSMGSPMKATLPVLTDLTNGSQDLTVARYVAEYIGGSSDLSHALLNADYSRRLLPSDSVTSEVLSRLYEIDGVGTASATLRRVDVEEGGAEMGPQCGSQFGGYKDVGGNSTQASTSHAISDDGARIFFSGRPGANAIGTTCDAAVRLARPLKVFARVGGAHTVQLSATECTRGDCSTSSGDAQFQAASAHGGRVAFLSSDQLANSDVDTTSDVYVYDFDKPSGAHLKQVSAGDATNATPGAGANAKGVVRLSDDGTRVYFVATGKLTTKPNPAGQVAVAGNNNLYVYGVDSGETSYIGALSSGDNALWENTSGQRPAALADPAGAFLLFSSSAQLVGGDTDTARDVYRYDAGAATPELVKVSDGNSADDASIPSGETGARAAGQPRRISADGQRVIFLTSAALSAEDTNGAADVYLWEDGVTQLASDGHDPNGVDLNNYSISSDGKQVAFATSRRLVPEDVDDVVSTYVAREGDDIVRTPIVVPHCTQDACQGTPTDSPFTWTPAPPADGGIGNVPGAEPTFSVKAVTTTGRAQLAKNGSTKLSVTVSDGGTVVATARGSISKQDAVLGTAKANPTKGGTISLTLKLTKAARSELAKRGKLSVKLSVTHSKVAVVRTQTLSLKKAKAAKKAASKKKASKKKASKKRASAHSVKRDLGR